MNPVVVSPQRNANNFVGNCISSVAQQSIVPRHIIIDDCSSDETAKILSGVASRYSHTEVILNDDRKYRLENIYDTVQSLCDDDIVLLLDGDDWFGYTNVVEKVLEKYSDQRVEYVYTNWQYSHAPILGISKKIPGSDWEPYSSPWITSAMGTFRARWFKKIPKANFLDENGNFFKMGTDQAYILPMLHMLKERDGDYRGVQFIDEPLYVYQFVENEMRRRVDVEGEWERKTANDSSRLIRSRGFLNE